MTKLKWLLILFIATVSIESWSQKNVAKNNFLEGLTKSSLEELGDQQIMLDGKSIPIYLSDGKRIKGQELMQLFMSGDYTPEPYVDKDNDIKAIVLRKATEDEKKKMMVMKDKTRGSNKLVGTKASLFSVADIKGEEYNLEKLQGKVVVLNFWFIACKPCLLEIPDLNKLVAKYAEKEVIFIGLAMDKKAKLEKFLKSTEFKYNIVPNTNLIAKQYGISSYPTHLIIGKDLKITYATSGLSTTTVDEVDRAIAKLLDEK